MSDRYQALLGRAPDRPGREQWTSYSLTGTTSASPPRRLAGLLAASDEYYTGRCDVSAEPSSDCAADAAWTAADGHHGRVHSYQQISPLEIAGGVPVGLVDADEVPPVRPTLQEHPADALEAVLVPALDQQPCLISFSGGRDSSLVLAAAVRAAQRYGLPKPVPITLEYRGVASADESAWQELVVRSVGVDDWVRVPALGRVELLGPEAAASLERRGLLWPPTLHTFHVLLERAVGGALVTGEGGDEYLGARRSAALRYLLDRRLLVARRHLRPIVRALAPGPLRGRTGLRSALSNDDRRWMRGAARRQFLAEIVDMETSTPLRWDRSIAWLDRRRFWVIGQRNRRQVATEHGVALHDPLTDARFTRALAAAGGAAGFLDRTQTLHRFFDDLLPAAVLARRDKAYFSEVASGEHVRQFARTWDGTGVDDDLVDADALREEWLHSAPHAGTLLLLHQAWLAQRGRAT